MTKRKIKTIWKISLGMVIFLGLLYIFQVLSLAHYAHQLTLLKQKQSVILKNNSLLEIQITSNEPIFQIEKLAQDFNFEKINQVRYIEALKGPVAAK